MTISKPFSTTGWEGGMAVLDDDGCDYGDDQISSAKIWAGRMFEKSWASGSRVSGDPEYGERGIRSLSHRYEGGGVCIRDDAEGNDDEGRLLVSQVRTRRGIKRRHAVTLDFRVSSGKRKTMVYDDDVCDKHLVSQDFPECSIRTDGFESGVSIGETKIRNFGPSCVFEEEEVGGCKQRRLCLNSLVSDEEEEISVIGKKKKKKRRRRKRKKKCKKTEENEYIVPEGTHDPQVSREEGEMEDEEYTELVEEEVGGCKQRRLCLNSLVSDEEEEISVIGKKKKKKRRRRKRKKKKKCKKTEENEYIVPEGTHDPQVSREEGEMEDEEYTELVEEEVGGCKQRRLCLNSLVSDEEEEISVVGKKKKKKKRRRRKRKRKKKCKKTEENEYIVPEGTHDPQVSREVGEMEDEEYTELVEEEVGGCKQRRLCLNSLVSDEEEEISVIGKKKRRRRKRKKCKKTEENEYVVPEGTLDRQVSREEGEVEDEEDAELVIKEKQNASSMKQRKRYASEFAHCEVSVKRTRGEGGVERLGAGDIVWANSSEEEWWPGWVFMANKSKVLVPIFGQDKLCWLNDFQVLPFEENYVEKSKNAGGQLKVAIDNALEELGKRAALGLICSCEGLVNFNENEKSAVVDVPGYSKSSHYTLEQINKARAEFRPLEMLCFLQKAALSVFICESDTVGANRAIAQANAYRRVISITPDWIYRETMRLTEMERAYESDKGNWEAEPLASSLADNELCYRAYRSSNSLMVEVAAEEVENQVEVDEAEDGEGEEGAKNNLTIVERKEEEKDKVCEQPLHREEFQWNDMQKSNILLSLERSHEKLRNKTFLQEEIKGIEESEEDKLDLGFCVTNEMDFSSFSSNDQSGPQVSGTREHIDVDEETNADDVEFLSDHRIKTASSRANEFRINPQQQISIETNLPSLFETLTHLHRLALDPFYDSDGVAFVFEAFLRYRDVTFLNIPNLKCLEVTLDRHCECSNSTEPKISVSPSYVAEPGSYATILDAFKKDSFEISSNLGGRENLKYSSFSSVPNSDMLSRPCQRMTTVASKEFSSVGTKMPSLLDTLTHLRCLALDPFSGAACAAFVSKAFLRYRAVTFLNIANLKFSEGTLNRHFRSGKNATREASTALPSVMEQGNGTTSNCHAKKDVFGVGAIPYEIDEVKGVSSSSVLDDAMLSRTSEQETNTAFNAVNKVILNVHGNLSFEANLPSLCETLTHLHCLALDPFYDPENVAFVCKTLLRYRAVSSSFFNVPDSDILSRSRQYISTLPSQECNSVDTKMPSLLDTLTHLRCLALDPFSGTVCAAFVSKAFLRYRAVTFLNITNLKFSGGILNRHLKSSENSSRENGIVLPSVTEQGNGTTSVCHAKKDTFEVGAVPHERDTVKFFPCSAVPDDAMLSRISERESNKAFPAVNKLILNVQENLSVEAIVPSLYETLTHLRCLALDHFYDPENVAFVCKAFLRYRAVNFKLKSLKDTHYHHRTLSNNAAQEIVTVTSASISGSKDGSSFVYHDNKKFGIGRVLLEKTEVRKISGSAVRSEKDQRSCKSQQTQNPVSLVEHMGDPLFSSKSLTTSNKQQISTSNVVNLGKTASGWSIHLGVQRSEEPLVSLDDDRAKDSTNEDLAVEINGKTLALSEQTSGFSVAESCVKRRTSLVFPGITAPSATSGVGLLYETHQLLDEITQDESWALDHRDANSRGGLAVISSAKQHDFDDAPRSIAQRHMGSSLATSLGEILMFLRCLACDLSYGGKHLNLVKEAFLRYRVASYHKNFVEYRPGLCKSLEHTDSGSLLTKSCPNYISATAMPGDSQSPATDRIPDVSLTTDNKGAGSDGGLSIQMATDQHDLDYATEICNSLSIAQGQFCSSSVKTLLGEMYLFLRCLACDPFIGGEHSTSAKRAFLRYRVASYEKIYGSSAVEYRHGMSNNHERLVSHSLSKTWPISRAIMDGLPDDIQKEKNATPENDTKSKNQCFSSTATYAIPQTNGSGCAQNVSVSGETTSHTDLSKCFGNSFPRKRKSDETPAANPLHKLRKPCGAVLLSNWYASPLTRDGLSRSVDGVQLPARSPTECTKIGRFFISPESHEVGSYLHMKFPKNFELPSQDQLMKTFGKFGPIDCLKTRVFFYTGSGQVCFQRHADAEAAFKFAREKVLFGQANIKFWVSRAAKSTHGVQGYNCTDIVGKPKSGESGNDYQSLYLDEQQLKDYDYTNRARLLPISNVKSCLRKLNQPGEKGQPKSSKVTFSVDSQSCLPAESIMSPLTLPCNHSLRKESGIYEQKMLSLLKDCEQLINDTKGSVGLQSYYEMLTHELRSSFRKPDE